MNEMTPINTRLDYAIYSVEYTERFLTIHGLIQKNSSGRRVLTFFLVFFSHQWSPYPTEEHTDLHREAIGPNGSNCFLMVVHTRNSKETLVISQGAGRSGPPSPYPRASVRRTYAVYYVQKSAAYAEITHQRRTADF